MQSESAAPESDRLVARGLRVSYGTGRAEVPAVRGVDLTLRAGEIVGLTGESGSGKSTAASALLGLVRAPGRIVSGSVEIAGRDILSLSQSQLREVRGRDISLIVQNPRAALHPILKVGKQISQVRAAHAGPHPSKASLRRQQVVDLLRAVGIADPERRANAFPHELSGGMAQRVLIAMALSTAPRYLIADEPTSGLDVTVQAQFLDLMAQTVRARGMGLLLVTQEPGILWNYCDRVLVMAQGKIIEDQPTPAYFRGQPAPSFAMHMKDSPAGAVVLQISQLSHQFAMRQKGQVLHAVNGVDLTLRAGETLGLVGESGSGKTTVGRCLVGLLSPSAGEIYFRAQPLFAKSGAPTQEQRRALQFVRQDPFDSLNPRWSIERNLREPLDLHTSLDASAKRSRIHELLKMVGSGPEISHLKPRDLGAGILQRINIARALACEPTCIVLDEPTSMLEPRQRVEVIDVLRHLQQRLGTAYVFISHDLTTIASLCHRVAVMYLGQIVELGSTADIFNHPKHPYTRALIDASLPVGMRRRADRQETQALRGEIPSPIDLPSGCFLATRCRYVVDFCRSTPQPLTDLGSKRFVRCGRAAAGQLSLEESHEH